MDVTHIEETFVGCIFRTAVAADNEDVVLWRQCDGNGVVERGGSSVRTPVHGINADVRGGNDSVISNLDELSLQRYTFICEFSNVLPIL